MAPKSFRQGIWTHSSFLLWPLPLFPPVTQYEVFGRLHGTSCLGLVSTKCSRNELLCAAFVPETFETAVLKAVSLASAMNHPDPEGTRLRSCLNGRGTMETMDLEPV